MMQLPNRKSRNQEKGQVLILAVIAAIIIVVAVLCLFDIQSVIRTKIKSQTAVDAAALAAANWQRYSLNLIGELNMIKASTVLVSDIPPLGDDSSEGISQASDLMTEMQVRISFAGPVIGFGAAQQAAKNNGLNYNEGYTEVVKGHVERLEDDLNGPYQNVSQNILGYEWREPYTEMVRDLYYDGKGVAVATNTDFLGIPRLKGDSDFLYYLQQKWVYNAIRANYWCALREILRMDFGAPGSKWWGNIEIDYDSISFSEECEYIPLHIDFSSGSAIYNQATAQNGFTKLADRRSLTLLGDAYDRYDPDDRRDTDSKIDPLPLLNWAVYDWAWSNYSRDLIDAWSGYLRDTIRAGYAYRGAVAKVTAEVEPQTKMGDWGENNSGNDIYLGDALNISDQGFGDAKFSTYARRLKNAERQMKTGIDMIRATAVAKPLGALDSNEKKISPNSVAMILPVFERAVIIPVSLEAASTTELDPFDYKWYAFITEYLPALGSVGHISDMGPNTVPDPSHWPWFIYYHNALLKLDDPDWRQEGIVWLDTPIEVKEDPITHEIIVIKTKEDTCDDWPSGGSGSRAGPSFLH